MGRALKYVEVRSPNFWSNAATYYASLDKLVTSAGLHEEPVMPTRPTSDTVMRVT